MLFLDLTLIVDDVLVYSQILLYQVTKQETYKKSVEAYFQHWFPNGTILITPKGLGYKEIPGSLRYAGMCVFDVLILFFTSKRPK